MFKLFDPVWECVFYLDLSCKFSKLQYNSLAFVAGFKRATDEGSLPEIAQYSPYYLPLNVFTASRGSNLYIILIDSVNVTKQLCRTLQPQCLESVHHIKFSLVLLKYKWHVHVEYYP